MLDLGAMRHRLVYEVPVDTRDLDGGVVTQWRGAGILWAQVEPLSGRKLELAQRQEPRATHRVKLRYHATLQTGDRFLLDGARVLHVHSIVDTDEGRDEMVVLCEEVRS